MADRFVLGGWSGRALFSIAGHAKEGPESTVRGPATAF
ncbi:MAG: hypothetical protein HSCHL_0646 [Hydrogenibacillus schlegelii]|uniref:Uncharacterized protein n=1 Tax=Hydrogenibacillus schlegelii TaxID=1484 RepID=A0A2T5G7Y9_HYDSH|nr:MAG: hypothetical protein HSCHL_0646 [Hydrogenibacillus schlegelii]